MTILWCVQEGSGDDVVVGWVVVISGIAEDRDGWGTRALVVWFHKT
jgi:hypothetical protein